MNLCRPRFDSDTAENSDCVESTFSLTSMRSRQTQRLMPNISLGASDCVCLTHAGVLEQTKQNCKTRLGDWKITNHSSKSRHALNAARLDENGTENEKSAKKKSAEKKKKAAKRMKDNRRRKRFFRKY